MDTNKLKKVLCGDQQNLEKFPFMLQKEQKTAMNRKKITASLSIALQVQVHKRNHDACALCSLLSSSRDWSDILRYSSTLEVHSGFTSRHNLVSQRPRSKSGFRIEELDGESKCWVVQWLRRMKTPKSLESLSRRTISESVLLLLKKELLGSLTNIQDGDFFYGLLL